MINVTKLSYSFPQKDLYNEVSFSIEQGDHCAFIGTSGTGKSTLINILLNPDDYLYDGKVEIDSACRIGYVKQFSQLEEKSDMTVMDYISEDFKALESKITRICEEMASSEDLESLMEDYQNALDALEAIGGDNYESIIEKNLYLANLTHIRDLKVTDLSGGEFKLIQIIKNMLGRPELLIMDEPDVFLDFENLNGLKKLMNAYKGMLLIITHNRYLLNHCFNKIMHLENGDLQTFEGIYVDYNLSLLQSKIDLQEQSIADEEEIERNGILIDKLRFIATHNAEAARGKSLKARVKFQERLEARRTQAPFVEIKKPKIEFLSPESVSDDEDHAVNEPILSVKDYALAFDDVLLKDVNFDVNPGEKIALIGPNGTGKTTLLRHIYKNMHEEIIVKDSVKMGYLSQNQGETLCEDNTVTEEFVEAGFDSYREIRMYLRRYGFELDNLDQKISSLSGGEKNILQLAKVGAKPYDLLLLDEPTSHLDTHSQIALEEAIEKFKGAVVMISHDFYSIVNCMDYVLYIDDKTTRKVSMRKFRKMIYKNHFNKNYLEIEDRKKEYEIKVAHALQDMDFELARKWSEKLETIIKALQE